MKTIRPLILFLVLVISFCAYSQDTISTHITSGCLTDLRFAGPPEYHFFRTADSITIYGRIGANCGSSHIAIIRRTTEAIIVTTKDTGDMATCSCNFNFKITFQASLSDSLIIFNDSLFNLNEIVDGLFDLEERSGLIDVFFDPAIESLRIGVTAGIQIKQLNIFDNYGRLILSTLNDKSLIDMSGFESGIYLLNFKLYDNSHIMKKVAKK